MTRKFVLCCAVALGVSACGASNAREGRDFERMRRQQRYDPYDVGAGFANGAVMQAPVTHTVARDDDTASAAPIDGATQYVISCAPCHGAGGFGGGPIAPNLGDRRPPSLRSPHVASMDTAALVAVITGGVGRMPPLGWQLTPAKRAAIAGFLKRIAGTPSTAETRADSVTAAYLARVDSLAAAGGSVKQVLQLRRPE